MHTTPKLSHFVVFPPPTIPPTKNDGSVLEREGGIFRLFMVMNKPTESEIQSIHGDFQFAVKVHKSVIFLLYKTGSSQWSSAPFSICIYDDWEERMQGNINHPILDGTTVGTQLDFNLMDSSSGQLVVGKQLILPPKISKALHDATIAQLANKSGYSRDQFTRDVGEAYRLFSTDAEMLKSTQGVEMGFVIPEGPYARENYGLIEFQC